MICEGLPNFYGAWTRIISPLPAPGISLNSAIPMQVKEPKAGENSDSGGHADGRVALSRMVSSHARRGGGRSYRELPNSNVFPQDPWAGFPGEHGAVFIHGPELRPAAGLRPGITPRVQNEVPHPTL